MARLYSFALAMFAGIFDIKMQLLLSAENRFFKGNIYAGFNVAPANLLRPGYRIVGVGAVTGCFNGQRHTLMVTTDFAGR